MVAGEGFSQLLHTSIAYAIAVGKRRSASKVKVNMSREERAVIYSPAV